MTTGSPWWAATRDARTPIGRISTSDRPRLSRSTGEARPGRQSGQQRGLPAREVAQARHQTPVTYLLETGTPTAAAARIRRSVPFSKVRDDLQTIVMEARTQHLERLKHVAMGERTKARASRAPKHQREKPVASVRIHALRPWRKRKVGHPGDPLEDSLLGENVIGRAPGGDDQVEVLRQPRGVPQQVSEVDRLCPDREFWQPTHQRVVKPQLTALSRQQHAQGRELFRQRSNVERRRLRGRDAVLEAREPPCTRGDQAIRRHHADYKRWPLRLRGSGPFQRDLRTSSIDRHAANSTSDFHTSG